MLSDIPLAFLYDKSALRKNAILLCMDRWKILDLLHRYWWFLGVIAALVLLGWNAAQFASDYQTADAAASAMASHEQAGVERFDEVQEDVGENASDVEDLRYINVRIEVGRAV